MTQHARGTFTVEVKPLTPAPAEGIARYSINKQLHGDLEGSTQGEMFSAGDPQHGDGLKGITGTFVIVITNGQHSYEFSYELPAN